MKKLILLLALPLIVTASSTNVANAQNGYYMSQEEYEQEAARQDNLENQADMQEYALDAKVAAAEEQEAKEQAEADEANRQLLIYVAVGVGIISLIFFISHSLQKSSVATNTKK